MATETLDRPAKGETAAPQTISVNRGDYILLVSAKNAWFKASADTKTTPERPVLARALDPFSYEKDSGAAHGEPTKNLPVARFYSQAEKTEYGQELPAGHRQLVDERESKRYIEAWERGIVQKSVINGKGIREVKDPVTGLMTFRFSTAPGSSEW